MNAADLELRNETYRLFVDLGRAPTADEVAAATGRSVLTVAEGWRRLHSAHALVLHGSGDEIRMANPFSAVATKHRVRARDRWWYANCAWDALGVPAALGVDGWIESVCADCEEPISIDIVDGRPSEGSLLFHTPVPAAAWWDDIGFT